MNVEKKFMDKVTTLAKHKYAIYGKDADNKSWDGRPMPQWDDLGDAVQRHWLAVAHDELTRFQATVKKIVDLLMSGDI